VLAEEQAATAYREWFWANAARLGGTIQRPKDAPRWSLEQREAFRDQWRSYQGPENAGKTVVLEDGMVFEANTATARDSQLIEARKLTREEVAAAYHVPPAMIGITEAQGYGSIREQHKVLYTEVLGPWLEMLTTDLELQLVPDFGDSANVYLEFQIAAKLQGAFEEQAAAFSTAVGSPWMTRNEARARQNLPRIDDPDFDIPITRLDVAEGQAAARPVEEAL
jgi:HK97 family phage portal protein